MFRFPLCLLVVYDLCLLVLGLAMLGPVDLYFRKIEQCDPEKRVVDFWVVQRRINRSVSVLDITVNNPYPIDETVVLELKGWMKKEGGYKPGAMYFKDTACTTLDKLLGDMFHDILRRSGTEECPLPTGYHEVLGYYFDNDKFTVPQVYGEYKLDIFLYKDEELQSCYVIYYEFVPKPS